MVFSNSSNSSYCSNSSNSSNGSKISAVISCYFHSTVSHNVTSIMATLTSATARKPRAW